MNIRVVISCVALVCWLSEGCNEASRQSTLAIFFDGVPQAEGPEGEQASRTSTTLSRQKRRTWEHGPYAAKQCSACHQSSATNALVVPREELCFRCHGFEMDKKYVHGPLAGGGCIVCHDPHSSPNRFLLVAESATFCLYCHDSKSVAETAAHKGTEEQCTTCHDPHMSDEKYLLR